jgi:hypothetical protein
VGRARVGIGDGIRVYGSTVSVGLLATDVRVFIEGVLEDWDGNLNGFLLHFLNGNFNLEGLINSAHLSHFLGDLNDNFLHVSGRDLHLVRLLNHLGVLNFAWDLLLAALIDDFGAELCTTWDIAVS